MKSGLKKRYNWTGSTSLGAYLISATSSYYDWALNRIIHNKYNVAPYCNDIIGFALKTLPKFGCRDMLQNLAVCCVCPWHSLGESEKEAGL